MKKLFMMPILFLMPFSSQASSKSFYDNVSSDLKSIEKVDETQEAKKLFRQAVSLSSDCISRVKTFETDYSNGPFSSFWSGDSWESKCEGITFDNNAQVLVFKLGNEHYYFAPIQLGDDYCDFGNEHGVVVYKRTGTPGSPHVDTPVRMGVISGGIHEMCYEPVPVADLMGIRYKSINRYKVTR